MEHLPGPVPSAVSKPGKPGRMTPETAGDHAVPARSENHGFIGNFMNFFGNPRTPNPPKFEIFRNFVSLGTRILRHSRKSDKLSSKSLEKNNEFDSQVAKVTGVYFDLNICNKKFWYRSGKMLQNEYLVEKDRCRYSQERAF